MNRELHKNRLADEKSPYLLQHAYNPVNWYPWGDDAFSKAVKEDKPVFLSIGYSTCHWCHVMEKESFEDPEIAQLLNSGYISVKVDREERPDIDHVYMSACQAFTSSGGWPLTIIMTPDKKPFFAGTYFPKNSRNSIPGLADILIRAGEAWSFNRDMLVNAGNNLASALSDSFQAKPLPENEVIPDSVFDKAFSDLTKSFDPVYGGFSSAPKFPSPHTVMFLLRYFYVSGNRDALSMAEKTLDSIYRGGIHDHIGFGFCRYSTDSKWLAPHFEKMLYDNALLADAYLEAFLASGKKKYADTAEKIFTYILTRMTHPDGGFYSAEDADSEGVEGKFYLWDYYETKQILDSSEGELFCSYFDITEKGNFEGKNIPNLINSMLPEDNEQLAALIEKCRQTLFYYREKRQRPGLDDKILTGWNGLMIAALAAGGRILGKQEYTDAAEKAAAFILQNMVCSDGRLLARWRDQEAAFPAYSDDYAYFCRGLIELYETTYKPEYLEQAVYFTDKMLDLFEDPEKGGLYITGKDSEKLIARPMTAYDGAVPSGNSAAAMNLIKLSRLTGRLDIEEKALKLFQAFGSEIREMPRGYLFFVSALLYLKNQGQEVIITGKAENSEINAFISQLNKKYLPFTVSLLYTENHENLQNTVPLINSYSNKNIKAQAYVCRNLACLKPVTDPADLEKNLQ